MSKGSSSEGTVIQLFEKLIEEKGEQLKLSELELSSIPLHYLPQCSVYLKVLDISYNQFQKLPTEIYKLENLQILNVSRNKIRSFEEFKSLPATLQELNLSHNLIKSISFNETHKNLKKINLGYNRIGQIEALYQLQQIKLINLDYNGISKLPDEFDQLKNLKTFTISGNLIREIPKNFSGHQNIKQLNFSHNKITFIPDYLNEIQHGAIQLIIDGNPVSKQGSSSSIISPPQSPLAHSSPSLHNTYKSSSSSTNSSSPIESPRNFISSLQQPQFFKKIKETVGTRPDSSILISRNKRSNRFEKLPSPRGLIHNLKEKQENETDSSSSGTEIQQKPRSRTNSKVKASEAENIISSNQIKAQNSRSNIWNVEESGGNNNNKDSTPNQHGKKKRRKHSIQHVRNRLVEKEIQEEDGEEDEYHRILLDNQKNKDHESLLSLDVRTNLLLRAIRIRLDCKELLNLLLQENTSTTTTTTTTTKTNTNVNNHSSPHQNQDKSYAILLPPNIILSEQEIDYKLVCSHIIKFSNSKKTRFQCYSGETGSISYKHKTIDICNRIEDDNAKLQHHITFDLNAFGLIHLIDNTNNTSNENISSSTSILSHGSSQILCILINDVIVTNTKNHPFRLSLTNRTFDQFLDHLPVNKRKRFESKIDRFIRYFRRELNHSPNLPDSNNNHQSFNPSEYLENEINRNITEILEKSLFFSAPLPSKREITNLRCDIRKRILKNLYNDLFKFVGCLTKDKEIYDKLQKLKSFTLFSHLELPFDLKTVPLFYDCKNLFLDMQKEICPKEKLEILLKISKNIFSILSSNPNDHHVMDSPHSMSDNSNDNSSESCDNFQKSSSPLVDSSSFGADQFFPSLVYLIIFCYPSNLFSNLKYIECFCSSHSELTGEASYYHINFLSAIRFFEQISAKDFANITEDEFNRYMIVGKNESLPPITSLNFIHHTIDDIQYNEIPNLLQEYQKLAQWYIASLNVQKNIGNLNVSKYEQNNESSSSIFIPQIVDSILTKCPPKRNWGILKVSNNTVEAKCELFHILRIPSKILPFSFEWLKYAVSAKFSKDSTDLIRITWNSDIVISDDADCEFLWDTLFSGEDATVNTIFVTT